MPLYLISIISACSNRENTISTVEKTESDPKISELVTESKISFSQSIIMDGTDTIIYPLNLNIGNDGSYDRSVGNTYWNLAFYNVISRKSELLTNKKLVINTFNVCNREHTANYPASVANQFIFYEITNDDFDGDKKLTSKDPKKLFISNLGGKFFIQISPENYAINNWKIDEAHNLVLMDVLKDTNGDKIFNEKDLMDHFVYDLKKQVPAQPVFDDAFKKQLKNLAKKVL